MDAFGQQIGNPLAFTFAQAGNGAVHDPDAQSIGAMGLVVNSGADLVVEKMNFLGNADADAQIRAVCREDAGRQVRRVGELLRDAKHALPGRFADSRAAVQRPVDRADRNSGQFGNLVDPGTFHFATTFSVVSIRSTELPPTMILNVPGSTTRCMSRLRNESSSGPSVNSTICVLPGSSVMRRKPLSSLTGRVMELTSSRMYSCTTSSPRTAPVLVTSTDTFVLPSGPIVSGDSVIFPYLNVE